GCLDTFVLNPDINIQNIQASFIASDTILGCPPLSVNFTNTSVGQVSNAWFFGNGGQASTLNAASVYTTSGIFLAKLIVTSANGCQDSAFQNIHINGPQGTFTYSPLSGCAPVTVQFTANVTGTSLMTYDFDNGVTQSTTGNTMSYTYTSPGLFVPKLILSDGSTCTLGLIGGDTVKVDVLETDFIF